MAYSMFEKPKLCITASTKFYPAEDAVQSHIPYRQRYSGFELDSADLFSMIATKITKGDQKSISRKSSMDVKCPIYVHEFGKLVAAHQDGDFGNMKKAKKGKIKKQPASVLNQLEETYWAMWKPEKLPVKDVPVKAKPKSALPRSPPRSAKDTIDVIKNSPQARKLKIFPERKHKKIASKSKEIQTDESLLKPVVSNEQAAKSNQAVVKKSDSTESDTDKGNSKTFLKHTDSYILYTKRQNKEKGEHFEQPKCIRLYKKSSSIPSTATGSFIKGGSYPLKSCLRKDSSLGKSNIRLGRPGSPMMLSTSNYKSKAQKK